MRRGIVVALLLCLVVAGAAGCGSSGAHTTTSAAAKSPLPSLKSCLERRGYKVDVEPPRVRATAPRSFEFVAVWNLLNPNRIALAVTISRTPDGAARAAAWLRKTNKKIAKGAVHAPVAQFGRIDVLWTAQPNRGDMQAIYPCVRPSA